MPTPVATARQCLTEEAARALDDAVSVAKRRNHAQTTSLHAVSALLSPSFSLLRESLARARSSAYSPRLQFRALELCVGASLDRLQSSKSQDDGFAPPISNSLMAAIKRSQANQRRQPDMYHLNNLTNINNISNNNNPISISSIKVELKHFVLSILDDPIVSRVFADAGFRSSDIKLAIIHPPVQAPARWASTRCPPLFLCNLMDFPPFGGGGGGGGGGGDEYCRRIGEVMVKGRERNPVLVGVCAKDALAAFKDCVEKGRYEGLPMEVHGVRFLCLEREISLFVGRREKEGLELKLKEVSSMVESCSVSGSGSGLGPGVVVNLGELKTLVEDEDGDGGGGCVEELVKRLSGLVEVNEKKIWLIGTASNYENYSKFVTKFPSVEKDWDLHLLPITSSRSSFDALSSKSSLMGSFVPFGGFFPTTYDLRPPLTAVKQPFTRCNNCKEMYERECAMLREEPSASMTDQYSASLPPWLQKPESDLCKGAEVAKQVKDVKTTSHEKIAALQKKWNDHCQHLHQKLTFSAPGVSLARPLVSHNMAFQFVSDKQRGSSSSSGDTSLNEGRCSNSSSGMQIVARNIPHQQKVMTVEFPKRALEISECHSSMRESSTSLAYPIPNLSMPSDGKPPSISVTTDLGLGMIYTSKCEEFKKDFSQDRPMPLQIFPGSISASQCVIGEKYTEQTAQSSFVDGCGVSEGLDPGDFKPLFRKLSEAVAWQCEAISRISQIVSCCKSGNRPHCTTNVRGGIWLSFLGPDKIGKRKVAEALADTMFGGRNHLITVDLSSQDKKGKADSLFFCQGSDDFDVNVSRITVADHIVQELCKKPHSVIFLENVDVADPLLQNSLSRAVQTGKFQDSRGREISINNVMFVATSSVTKDDKTPSPRKEFIKFTEERILEAKNWQMQIAVRSVPRDGNSRDGTRVSIVTAKSSSLNQGTSGKRKVSDICDTSEHLEVAKKINKTPKNSLDLNLPLEETEDATEIDSYDGDFLSDGSRAWFEDFLAKADGNVVFKPFDFDALADKLLRKIRLKFEEMLTGESMSLEIDYGVMVQILAAAWYSDNRGAVEDWIEQVLGACFVEARERYHLTAESVVSLVSCAGVPLREWAASICLPRTIYLSV